MEATVAERGQITLPKAVRDALGLTKGTQLKVELDGGRIILRKNVDDALSRLRGRFKLPEGVSTDDVMRELRGRAPGDPPVDAAERRARRSDRRRLLDRSSICSAATPAPTPPRTACAARSSHGPVVVCDVVVAEVVAGLGFGSELSSTRSRMPASAIRRPSCAPRCVPARCSGATSSAPRPRATRRRRRARCPTS